MDDTNSIWAQLSPINVNEHTEQKNGFTYLAWTWAWAEVKSRFPDASYSVEPENVLADGSMEVRTTVTIRGETLPMWLAVTDFKNRSLPNPGCADVANSRMRCLVKNIAMFGLGFYIYAGESLPQEPTASEEDWTKLLELMSKQDAIGIRVFSDTVGSEVMTLLFNNAEQGKKTAFKDEVRDLYRKAVAAANESAEALRKHMEADDSHGVMEVWEELNRDERFYVRKLLTETEAHKLEGYTND